MKRLAVLALAFLLSGCSVSLPFVGQQQQVRYYVLVTLPAASYALK